MKPLISFVIPTYNCLSYLKPCLESIEKVESRDQLEVIIVNDGSTDGTKEYLDSLQRHNYKVIHQENGGLSHARNEGVKLVSGEFLYFCDSDDEVIPENFEQAITTLKSNVFDLLVFNFKNEKFDGTINSYYPRKFTGETDGVSFLYTSLKEWSFGGEGYQFLIKRSLFGNSLFPTGRIHEDDYIYPSVFKNAKKVFVSSLPIYFRKFREGSATRIKKNKIRCVVPDQLFNIQHYNKEAKRSNNPVEKTVFQTLQIRTWIHILHYLKHDELVPDRIEILKKRPSPWVVLFRKDLIRSYRMKYFRRSLFF